MPAYLSKVVPSPKTVVLIEGKEQFLRHQRVPDVFDLRIYNRGKRRTQQGTTKVLALPFKPSAVPRLSKANTARDLVQSFESAFSATPLSKHWSVKLHGPVLGRRGQSRPIDGHTRLATLQANEQTFEAANCFFSELGVLTTAAEEQICEARAITSGPAIDVARAYLRALVTWYGPKTVKKAALSLRLAPVGGN